MVTFLTIIAMFCSTQNTPRCELNVRSRFKISFNYDNIIHIKDINYIFVQKVGDSYLIPIKDKSGKNDNSLMSGCAIKTQDNTYYSEFPCEQLRQRINRI